MDIVSGPIRDFVRRVSWSGQDDAAAALQVESVKSDSEQRCYEKAGGIPELELPRKYSPPQTFGEIMELFILYETRLQFVLVATDRNKDRCAMLRIDRSFPSSLVFGEDRRVYTWQECEAELEMLNQSNSDRGGLRKVGDFFGLVGFIRFTSCFYMGLINKRALVGVVAGHEIYSVEMIQYFQVSNTPTPANLKRSEDRYLKYLTNNDLTRDCYFSQSYNLTNTLQTNMGGSPVSDGFVAASMRDLFVWNYNLLTHGSFLTSIRRKFWGTIILHGYFEQRSYTFLTRQVAVTLIGRRSRHFAGKRYLKRGVTFEGHVANEVETEQILSDAGIGSHVRHSAFVQVRGSVPLFWSQVTDAMVPKPDIVLYRFDPLHEATQLHLQNLLSRYASPIFLLDTVKKSEKRPRETKLGGELRSVIDIIKGALDDAREQQDIELIQWDFNAVKKKAKDRLEEELARLARRILSGTGFFCSSLPALHTASVPHQEVLPGSGFQHRGGREQRGTVRTNCVDCLDRTNVCQYAISRAALSYQLAAHGIWVEAEAERDKAAGIHNLLSQMYYELGNRIAQQYAGTDAQEKRATAWGPQAKIKSVLVSINRYYQNSFNDADKQKAIDLFLGVYKPDPELPHLWDMDMDSHQIRRPSFERSALHDGGSVDGEASWLRAALRLFYQEAAPEDTAPSWRGGRPPAGASPFGSWIATRFRRTDSTTSNRTTDSSASRTSDGEDPPSRLGNQAFETVYETAQLSSFDELLRQTHLENFGVSGHGLASSSFVATPAAAASVEPSESGSAPASPAPSMVDRASSNQRVKSSDNLLRFLTPMLTSFHKKVEGPALHEAAAPERGRERSGVADSKHDVRGRMPWLFTPEGAQIRPEICPSEDYSRYAQGGELQEASVTYNPEAVLRMSLSPDDEACRLYRSYFDCSLDKFCAPQSASREAASLYVFTREKEAQLASYRKAMVDDLDPSRSFSLNPDPPIDNWVPESPPVASPSVLPVP